MTTARSTRLLYGFSGALALLFAAGLLYVISIVGASGITCPTGRDTNTGLDTDVSWWPPGENCGTNQERYVEESISWAPAAILALVGIAAVVMAISLLLEIRRMRHARQQSASASA